MKSPFAILLLGAFAAIAVFGVFAVNHGGHNHGGGCIATVAQRMANCPTEENAFGFLAFHLNALKSFSIATLSSSFSSALAALFAVVLLSFLGSVLFQNLLAAELAAPASFRRRTDFSLSHLLPAFARWIALHEKRDPARSF